MVSYLCAHHLRKQIPVVAVNLWREVVHTEHIVCTVGQDAGAIRGPSSEEKGKTWWSISSIELRTTCTQVGSIIQRRFGLN